MKKTWTNRRRLLPLRFGRYRFPALSAALLVFQLLGVPSTPALGIDHEGLRDVPFSPGEKLVYRGTWGIIPAGEVSLEVHPADRISGIDVYHFVMVTTTNGVVDLLYPVRERQDSYVDFGLTRSILYRKRTESRHPRDVVIYFDWNRQEATYSNFGSKRKPIGVLPGTLDPLALFFILRLHDLKEGNTIEIPLTDGERNISVKVTIGKKSIIRTKENTFEAIEITPDMESLAKVGPSDGDRQLKIWFTTDRKKIPVRIQSRFGLATFVFDLIELIP